MAPKSRRIRKTAELANYEIVVLAAYLVGGRFRHVDTEDVAVQANKIAPGRFNWRKYKDQINIENLRAFLSDAKKPKYGVYIIGSGKAGWLLTEAGVAFAERHVEKLQQVSALLPEDKLTQIYLASATDYSLLPPPDEWESVFNLTSK